jgi:chorismate synthase
MSALRFLTAGESHGRALVGIVEGVPAGLALDGAFIDVELGRRQLGHGRGGRMRIEQDAVEILAGVRHGRTLGSPIALLVRNRDWDNWSETMRVEAGGDPGLRSVHVPRPGHADLPGAVKYGHRDLRNVLERASARETAMRVAIGAVARRFLEEFGVEIGSRVVSIGGVIDPSDPEASPASRLNEVTDASPVRAVSAEVSEQMVRAIDEAKAAGDTLGGVFEVRVTGLPVGLGSHVHWDRRLDGELARAFMSLNAIKGVEIGLGFAAALTPGSSAHDELFKSGGASTAVRRTRRAGGVEGGITNGDVLVVRAAMKPLATLVKPLRSVDLRIGEEVAAHVERSDVCAVPAAAVIGEALAALVIADAFLVKFGGDSVEEVRAHHAASRTV